MFTKDIPGIKVDPDTTVGDWTYGHPQISRAYGGCKLKIGKFCSIGSGIQIVFWGKHQINDITTYPFNMLHGQGWPPVQCTEVKGENTYIGNDVWIANNAIIHQGSHICDGAVIGAQSVVKGRVDPYSVVVGNPAKEVKKRFNSTQIEMLLEMKWWNWPIEKIKEYLQIISSPNVEQLYEIWYKETK